MLIPLTRGQVAIIDDSDAMIVSGFSWHATPSSTGKFYASAAAKNANGRFSTLYMHRLITGAPKGKEVDHINHDTLDNRRENLRVGSHQDNMRNGKFALATHCPKGHPYDEKNTYRDKRGRRCKKCNALRVSEIYAKETEEQRIFRLDRMKKYYRKIKYA